MMNLFSTVLDGTGGGGRRRREGKGTLLDRLNVGEVLFFFPSVLTNFSGSSLPT